MQPPANTMVNTIGTLWPSALDHLRMRQRGLDDQADAGPLQQRARVASSMPADTSSMKPR